MKKMELNLTKDQLMLLKSIQDIISQSLTEADIVITSGAGCGGTTCQQTCTGCMTCITTTTSTPKIQ
jgi:hypothetical protein